MNEERSVKKKLIPIIGLGSVLLLMLVFSLYQGDSETSFRFLILLACQLLFSFIVLLPWIIPASSDTKFSHDEFGWTKWQIAEFPIKCPKCNHPLEINNLDWTGPEGARCSSCTNQFDVPISLLPGPDSENREADDDSFYKIMLGLLFAIIGISLAAVVWEADWGLLVTLFGVAVASIGAILVITGLQKISHDRAGKYSKQTWQVAEFPISCPECNSPIEPYKLKWVGSEEVRCPSCSSKIDFDTAVVTGPRLKPEYR
ncbi:MAG: hypothetical protein ACFFF4_12225 [Candidatus Thorarchaeota archaeon]